MDKKRMLNDLVKYYGGGNKARFANMLGVKPQTINTWEKRDNFDIELIFAKCEDLSGDWLLSGEGEMLRSKRNAMVFSTESESRLLYLSKTLVGIFEQKDQVISELVDTIKHIEGA